jgi:membrane protein DedA with SNARE-associated domain
VPFNLPWRGLLVSFMISGMPSRQFLVPQIAGSGVVAGVFLVAIVFMTLVIGWDASRRNGSGLPWGLVALLLGPVGWFLYVIFRPKSVDRA